MRVMDGSPLEEAIERAARKMAEIAQESDPAYSTKYYRDDATQIVLAAIGLDV